MFQEMHSFTRCPSTNYFTWSAFSNAIFQSLRSENALCLIPNGSAKIIYFETHGRMVFEFAFVAQKHLVPRFFDMQCRLGGNECCNAPTTTTQRPNGQLEQHSLQRRRIMFHRLLLPLQNLANMGTTSIVPNLCRIQPAQKPSLGPPTIRMRSIWHHTLRNNHPFHLLPSWRQQERCFEQKPTG